MTDKLENNYITEVLPQWLKVLRPMSSSPGWDLAMWGGDPRESDFEGQWGLIKGISQNWGKQTPLLEGSHKVSSVVGPVGKETNKQKTVFIRDWTSPSCYYWRLSWRSRVSSGSLQGQRAGSGTNGKYSLLWALLEVTVFSPGPCPTQQLEGSSAGTPQPNGNWWHGGNSPTH